MTQIAKKNNDLAKKYLITKALFIFGVILSVGSFLAFGIGMMNFNFSFSFPLMIGFAGGAILAQFMKRKADALKSGIVGENTTAYIISSLPENYVGFQNLKITYEGKTSELDMVVVGPTGVFVIETKNMGVQSQEIMITPSGRNKKSDSKEHHIQKIFITRSSRWERMYIV